MSELSKGFTVTCVIPTHERDALLRESLLSVVRQDTRYRFDVVVVDDASSPSTERVVSEVSQSHPLVPVKYVSRLGGGGASASRNFGAESSEATFLAFLDDDDLWDVRFLDKMIDGVVASSDALAVCGLDVLEEDGTQRHLLAMERNLDARRVAARNPGFTGSNFVVDRTIFNAIGGFDDSLPVSNDKDFLVRYLLQQSRYVVIDEFLAVHRRHAGPQLTRADRRRADGMERYLQKHKNVLTWGGRRFIRKSIFAIRRRLPGSPIQRLAAQVGYVATLSPKDIASRWRRRDGRFSEYQ